MPDDDIQLLLAKAKNNDPIIGAAIYAGGCFWGVEYYFQNEPGVIATQVGYIGGDTDKPTYQNVCSGATHHAEALLILYDKQQTNYTTLTKLFFEIHDPTQLNHQGPDTGNQYRSAVFHLNEEQQQITSTLIDELTQAGFNVVTQVTPAEHFWPAEDYHQHYYEKNGQQPYCHSRVRRFHDH